MQKEGKTDKKSKNKKKSKLIDNFEKVLDSPQQEKELSLFKVFLKSQKNVKKKLNLAYKKNGKTFLLQAAKKKNLGMCEILLGEGSNTNHVDLKKKNLLHFLSNFRESEITDKKFYQKLFFHVITTCPTFVDSPSRPSDLTPLHYASISQNLVALKILLKAFSFPNCQNIFGETPLHYSSKLSSHLFSPQQYLLLSYGANPLLSGTLIY